MVNSAFCIWQFSCILYSAHQYEWYLNAPSKQMGLYAFVIGPCILNMFAKCVVSCLDHFQPNLLCRSFQFQTSNQTKILRTKKLLWSAQHVVCQRWYRESPAQMTFTAHTPWLSVLICSKLSRSIFKHINWVVHTATQRKKKTLTAEVMVVCFGHVYFHSKS